MVIQRWQSLFLLIAAVLMGLFSFLSLGQVQTTDATFNLTALGFSQEGSGAAAQYTVSTWYLFAVSVLSALLSLIALFSFKQYKLQKRLCLLSLLMMACAVICAAQIAYFQIDNAQVSWSSMICAPFISIVCVIIAYNRINADHRIIADSERLR